MSSTPPPVTFRPVLTLLLNCLLVLISVSSILPPTHGIEYPIRITAPNTSTGVQLFLRRIGKSYARRKMESGTNFIWKTLHQSSPDDRKDYPRIELFIQNMARKSYRGDNRIAISADYIGNYTAGNLKREFTGVLYNQLVRVWAWDGVGQAPAGLLSGIADYVRMAARLETPAGWARPGDGERWDQGDDVTARFLEYCGRFKEGFVGELNRKMKDGYEDGYFKDLLGKSVHQVWKSYKARYP